MIQYSLFSIRRLHRYFFYLLLLLLPTQLGYHFWPAWSMVLGRRIDYLSPTLFFTDIIVLLLVVSYCISHVRTVRANSLSQKIFRIDVLFVVLFVATNIAVSTSAAVTLVAWMRALEIVFVGWYIVKTKPAFDEILPWFTGGAVYSSALAIAQFSLQHSVGGIFWFIGERTFTAATPGIAQVALCIPHTFSCPLFLRAYSTFPHPNVLGGYLAVILPLIVFHLTRYIGWDIRRKEHRLERIMYISSLFIGLAALLVSFSRSAWLVAIAAMCLLMFRSVHKKYVIVTLLGMLFVIAVAFTSVPLQAGSESVVVRQELNLVAYRVWQSAPWTGIGLNNFLVSLPHYLVNHDVYIIQPVHNIYLLMLSETGVIGFVIFCFIIFKILSPPRSHKRFSITDYLSNQYRVAFLSLLLLGFVDHYLLTLQQGRLLFVIVAALTWNFRLTSFVRRKKA